TPTRTATMAKTPDSSTPGTGTNRVRGNVRYYMCKSAVAGVEVELQGETSRMAKTGSDGLFDFGNVSEDHVDVHGAKQGSINGAVSALDVAYVLQAVAGERDLTQMQTIACDATGDGSVSPVD